MNTAVKTIAFDNILVQAEPISWQFLELRILVVMFLLLLSAFGLIYVKEQNRGLFNNYQKLLQQSEQLMAENNKLLLEQSSWAAQSRVQQIAEQQLEMQIPSVINTKMLKA